MNLIDIHTHHLGPYDIMIRNRFPEDDLNDPRIYYSVGLHPWFVRKEKLSYQIDIVKTKSILPKVLAIGESGLDKVCKTEIGLQTEAFMKQIEISEAASKPMIIHCVKAYSELLETRKEKCPAQAWIIHDFNSSLQMAEQLIESGCFLSFGERLFKTNSKACKVFPLLAEEKIFLETDESELTIEKIYERAAKLRETSINNLQKHILLNFKRVFTHARASK